MAIRAIVLSRLLLAFTILVGSTSFSLAQDDNSNYPIVLKQVTSTLVPSPAAVSQDTGNLPENIQEHDWLKVEFQFEVNPPKGQDYLDSATFKVYIEGRDYSEARDGSGIGIPVCFTGTVTYVNLYKGKKGYGVVYLDPSTVERYKGPHPDTSYFTTTFDVQVTTLLAGGVTYVNEHDDKETNKSGWPSQLKPIPNLVINRGKTPFILSDANKYPAEKQRGAAAEDSE